MRSAKSLPPGFTTSRFRAPSYPWDALLNGQWHILQHGSAEDVSAGKADYSVSRDNMLRNARAQAQARGMRIESAWNPDTEELAICAVPRSSDAKRKVARNRRK